MFLGSLITITHFCLDTSFFSSLLDIDHTFVFLVLKRRLWSGSFTN